MSKLFLNVESTGQCDTHKPDDTMYDHRFSDFQS